MFSIVCRFCHLPTLSKKADDLYCCYGCHFSDTMVSNFKFLPLVRIFLSIFFYGILLVLRYFPDTFLGFSYQQILWIFFTLTTSMLILLGSPLFQYTLQSVHRGRWVASEALMIIAILFDYGYSFHLTLFGWDEANYPKSYVPFYLTGLFLITTHFVSLVEAYARRRSYQNVAAMYALRPSHANRLVKNEVVSIAISEMALGDICVVKPGEIIPCDGLILSGTTTVDESAFTGEPTILLKGRGERVTGGSLNRDGTLQVRMDVAHASQFVNKLVQTIHEAIAHPPKIQRVMEKGFPALVMAVCLVALGVYFYYGYWQNPMGLLYGLSVLVFMGLFVLLRMAPMVIVLAIGRVARNGILIRSGDLFQKIGFLDVLALDKTGTLTEADFVFSRLLLEKGVNQGEILSAIFSLEANSKHPLARGVQTHPWYVEIPQFPVKNFQRHVGLGIQGLIQERGRPDRFVAVGNQRFLKRNQMYISRSMREELDELESMGETVILCGWDKQVRALMSFSDTLKRDVKSLIGRLKKLGVHPIMVTGDHDELISHLAYAHGIEQSYTRCLPEEKTKKIANNQEKGLVVGMLSNSIDEREALQKADVSFLIGNGTGSLEGEFVSAMVFGHRLLSVVDLIAYSRRVYRTIKFSFILGILYGVGGIVLSIAGLLTPIGALVAMVVSSMVLILFPLSLGNVRFGAPSPDVS